MARRLTLAIGSRHAKWTVIAATGRHTHYRCRCDCGAEREVHKNSLVHGYSTSCGCGVHEKKRDKAEEKLTGRQFGRLTVLSFSHAENLQNHWLCRCECGQTAAVPTHALTGGHTRSCGCLQKEMRASYGWNSYAEDKTGKRYGRLTVTGLSSHRGKKGQLYWDCRCDCGGTTRVCAGALPAGEVQSCGCLLVDSAKRNFTKHGMSGTPTYQVWKSMLARCRNPNGHAYPGYGGRGIAVCDSWRESFENFFKDMGERPAGCSLDRVNNDGNYEPGNCRWATAFEQNNNKSNTIFVVFDGRRQSLVEWARELGVPRKRLYSRIVLHGWPVEEAMTAVKRGKSNINSKRRKNKYEAMYKAHKAFKAARNSGDVIKPQKCEACDNPAKEAHHYKGYDFPLDVQWLCKQCHERNHHGVEFDGYFLTLPEWARRIGISRQALMRRLARWSKRKALTTPPRKQRRAEKPARGT